jgi:hypothetical protein
VAPGLFGHNWAILRERSAGTLTAKKNDRFDVTLTLPITTPAVSITLTFIGVLDHSGLDKEPIPELPTIMGDIFQ